MGEDVVVPGVLGEIELLGPSDFDGWDADLLATWVTDNAPTVAVAEQRADSMKATIGLGLWRLRQALKDGAYGERLDMIAREANVSVRTLHRWREAAETRFGLAAPVRALGQKRRPQLVTPPVTSAVAPAPPPVAKRPPRVATPPVATPSVVTPPPPVAGDDTVPCPRCQGSGTITVTKATVPGCPHPLVKRLGTRCTDCNQQVGTAGTIGGR